MEDLLGDILAQLKGWDYPDSKGNYVAWCPFHPDGQGKPPHKKSLSLHPEKGFRCFGCGESGGLRKLAEKLGIVSSAPRLPPREVSLPATRDSPREVSKTRDEEKSREVASYDYVDERGDLLYQVVRFEGEGGKKDFKQRRPDGKGGWIWGLGETRRILYQLFNLCEHFDPPVFLVEGEKDVDRLMELGLVATTSPMGAGNWKSSYNESLRDRDVIIIPDNDKPGKKHAKEVSEELEFIARSLKIVNLPGLEEKGDVSDWLDAGHSREQLETIVERAPAISVDEDEIEFQNQPDLGWLVEDLFPRIGVCLIYGQPASCKSFLALDLSLCVGTGANFADRMTRHGLSYYFYTESYRGGARRSRKWYEARELTPRRGTNRYRRRPANLADPREQEKIHKRLSQFRPAIVVIDPLLQNIGRTDENDAGEMGRIIQFLTDLSQEIECLIVIVHHTRKGDEIERGSSAIRGACDVMLHVKKSDNEVVARVSKMKEGEDNVSLFFEFNGDNLKCLPDVSIQLTIQSRQRDLLLRTVKNCCLDTFLDSSDGRLPQEGATMSDIMEEWSTEFPKITRAALRSKLKTLMEKGLIAMRGKTKSAQWYITRAGLIALGEDISEDPYEEIRV